MSLRSFNRYQKKATAYSLRLLLVVVVVMPGQLSAQCSPPLSRTQQSIAHVDLSGTVDCLRIEQPFCRLLLDKLGIAEFKVEHLSDNLFQLQQALILNRGYFSDAFRGLGMTGSTDPDLSVFGSVKNASLAVIDIARIHVAIGSVRSELIMANHERTSAITAMKRISRCLVLL